MSMDGADWLRTQLTSFGCAACGQPYESGRIRLLAERDGLFFVDLACTHCGTQAVAIVTIEVDEDDVPRAEPGERFEGGRLHPDPAPAVTTDDVLSMHALLSDFQGDVPTLLARLDGRRIPSDRPGSPGAR
jgi:hypothetical protein